MATPATTTSTATATPISEDEISALKTNFNKDGYQGQKLVRDLVDAKTKKIVASIGDKITKRAARKLEEGGLKNVFVENDELVGQYISTDIVNKKMVRSISRQVRK